MSIISWSVESLYVENGGINVAYPVLANGVNVGVPNDPDENEHIEVVVYEADSAIYNQHFAEAIADPGDLPDGIKRIFEISAPGKRLDGSGIE